MRRTRHRSWPTSLRRDLRASVARKRGSDRRRLMTDRTSTIDSTARSPGLSYQQLLDTDTHAVPEVLREESPRYFGSGDLPIDRYVSRAWHEREVDRLWSRVWQFACREEHIPEVGDYIVYEIVRSKFIVVRTAPDTIKAYWNSCLHRGRQIK